MYIHISINTSICDHLYLDPAKHEFISMSPTLIYYHKIILASFLLLIYNFPLQHKKPASHHLPSIYLVVQLHYTCIVVSELLTHTPLGNNTITRLQGLCRASFALNLTDFNHFQKYLSQHLFSVPPSAKLI